MKVMMKTMAAGADFAAKKGQVVEVSEARGKELIKGGYAVKVEEAAIEKIETKKAAGEQGGQGGQGADGEKGGAQE
jgi:hypothetical protein